MSGYDDYEYMKKALEFRVFSYILKPMQPAELIETVKNVILAIEEEKSLCPGYGKWSMRLTVTNTC